MSTDNPTDPDNPTDRRCTATSRTTGERCGRIPAAGFTVCKWHGARAPQVKAKAKLRLLELVDPAIATLAREMATADASSDKQRAANSILDRAGYGRATEVTLTPDEARAALVELLDDEVDTDATED